METVLWRELHAQGYTGSQRGIYRRLRHLRAGTRRCGTVRVISTVTYSSMEGLTP